MGIGHVCNAKKQLAIEVWEGTVSSLEWTDHIHRLSIDPAFPLVRSYVTDLRFASLDTSIDDSKVEQMANIVGATIKQTQSNQIAIAAGKEFVLSKLFERLVVPYFAAAIVFNHLDTACAWLGLDYIEIEQEILCIRNSMRSAPEIDLTSHERRTLG